MVELFRIEILREGQTVFVNFGEMESDKQRIFVFLRSLQETVSNDVWFDFSCYEWSAAIEIFHQRRPVMVVVMVVAKKDWAVGRKDGKRRRIIN
jgi:hypothetical protein